MKEVELTVDNKVMIPIEYQNLSNMVITMPWAKEVHRGRTTTMYFRSKENGDKPYLPEGQIHFKDFGKEGETFLVKGADQ